MRPRRRRERMKQPGAILAVPLPLLRMTSEATAAVKILPVVLGLNMVVFFSSGLWLGGGDLTET